MRRYRLTSMRAKILNGETGVRLMVQVNFKLSGVESFIFSPHIPERASARK